MYEKSLNAMEILFIVNYALLTNFAICFPSIYSSTRLGKQIRYTTKKSCAQLKASIGLRAEELYVYRSIPLGQYRKHNCYWKFVTCSLGNDPGSSRIFFESHEDGHCKVNDIAEVIFLVCIFSKGNIILCIML